MVVERLCRRLRAFVTPAGRPSHHQAACQPLAPLTCRHLCACPAAGELEVEEEPEPAPRRGLRSLGPVQIPEGSAPASTAPSGAPQPSLPAGVQPHVMGMPGPSDPPLYVAHVQHRALIAVLWMLDTGELSIPCTPFPLLCPLQVLPAVPAARRQRPSPSRQARHPRCPTPRTSVGSTGGRAGQTAKRSNAARHVRARHAWHAGPLSRGLLVSQGRPRQGPRPPTPKPAPLPARRRWPRSWGR